MQVSKKIPFDDPTVLNGVRALYLVSNLIMFSVYFYIGMQIKKKKGECAEHRDSIRSIVRAWLTWTQISQL